MTTYYRKAWEIIGYTLDGATYCPPCAESGDAMPHGSPLFVSDNWSPMPCESCREEVTA